MCDGFRGRICSSELMIFWPSERCKMQRTTAGPSTAQAIGRMVIGRPNGRGSFATSSPQRACVHRHHWRVAGAAVVSEPFEDYRSSWDGGGSGARRIHSEH
jgi:hypothetical protein